MPSLPDHWTIIEEADEAHPFRLATSPSRSFLNTTFNETPSSQAREGAPIVMIHPEDAAALGIADGDAVTLGNTRGETTLTAKLFDGVRRGVLIAESIHPNKAHIGGRGINMLTGAEAVAPVGGAAFHDNKVWVKKARSSARLNRALQSTAILPLMFASIRQTGERDNDRHQQRDTRKARTGVLDHHQPAGQAQRHQCRCRRRHRPAAIAKRMTTRTSASSC